MGAQDLYQEGHLTLDGHVDIIGIAKAASEVDGPATDKGIADVVGVEEVGQEATCHDELTDGGILGRKV